MSQANACGRPRVPFGTFERGLSRWKGRRGAGHFGAQPREERLEHTVELEVREEEEAEITVVKALNPRFDQEVTVVRAAEAARGARTLR